MYKFTCFLLFFVKYLLYEISLFEKFIEFLNTHINDCQ